MNTTYMPQGWSRAGVWIKDIPSDLSAWFSNSVLMLAVYEAIDETKWPPIARHAESASEAVLRTVVVFCYATGLYGSKEIEAAALHDPIVRYLCARNFPAWEQVRDFRRQNAPYLKQTLAHLLTRLYRRKMALEAVSFNFCPEPAAMFTPMPNLASEAENRLRRAIQADSMAMDD